MKLSVKSDYAARAVLGLARQYHSGEAQKVEELAAGLQREDTRLEASEMLRGLIETIVLTPVRRANSGSS